MSPYERLHVLEWVFHLRDGVRFVVRRYLLALTLGRAAESPYDKLHVCE
jgi:hypothetical protein